ncbi:MAG: hypothetical protein NPIRA03_39580 [Nitrospirales bacterium]|nr:MAG: hypothetical protein NPIRA03_39580 [Nitrospirales bacterium]
MWGKLCGCHDFSPKRMDSANWDLREFIGGDKSKIAWPYDFEFLG